MSNLYEINEAMFDTIKRIEHAETEEEQEALIQQFESVDLAFKEKLSNICKVIREMETDQIKIKSEAVRLAQLAESKWNVAERLKKYMSTVLQMQNIDKLDLDLFKLSFRKSDVVSVLDEAIIPIQYFTIKETKTVDKIWLKTYLKNGAEIPGVRLVENFNLQIK